MRDYAKQVVAEGIDSQRGSVIVRLAAGSNHSVSTGDRFEVLNSASKERWGILEVLEVAETSCVCQVSDRINVEFWNDLEERVHRDPSPPSGVTFIREIPSGLSDFIFRLILNWRG